MGTRIFISHAGSDIQMVDKLFADLSMYQFEVWFDRSRLIVGDPILEVLAREIYHSDHIVVLLSPDAIASKWVRKEVSLAMTREVVEGVRRVLPIMLVPCEVPHCLADILHFELGEHGNYEALLKKLITSLENKPQKVSWTTSTWNRVTYRLWEWRAFHTATFVTTLVALGLGINSLTYVGIHSNKGTSTPRGTFINAKIQPPESLPLTILPIDSFNSYATMENIRNMARYLDGKYQSVGGWRPSDCKLANLVIEFSKSIAASQVEDTTGIDEIKKNAEYTLEKCDNLLGK